MLTQIHIEKLFNRFDYSFELKKEGITILTGPNGYGKTTILRILEAFAKGNFLFIIGLSFKKITLKMSNKKDIEIEKGNESISIKISGRTKSTVIHKEKILNEINEEHPHLSRIRKNIWVNHQTDEILNTDELLQTGEVIQFISIRNSNLKSIYATIANIFPSIYFIREQRLLRTTHFGKHSGIHRIFSNIAEEQYEEQQNSKNTINHYAIELKNLIKDILAKASLVAQQLDSSFPRRLFEQTENITQEDFNKKFDNIKTIQRNLKKYGLSDFQEDSQPSYKEANAKALFVYIEDTEKKLSILSELLEKLDLFVTILNSNRLEFKKIKISQDEGFSVVTEDEKNLDLTILSSGEQQEIIMLYELLFRVKPNTLVLIDEPELSLHIVWQQQVLDDLFKIIEKIKVNMIIATHSPSIIGNYWRLTVDLWDLNNGKSAK